MEELEKKEILDLTLKRLNGTQADLLFNEYNLNQSNEFSITDEWRDYFVKNTKVAFEIANTITRRKVPLLLYGETIRNYKKSIIKD